MDYQTSPDQDEIPQDPSFSQPRLGCLRILHLPGRQVSAIDPNNLGFHLSLPADMPFPHPNKPDISPLFP